MNDKYSKKHKNNELVRWKSKQLLGIKNKDFFVIPNDVGHEQCRPLQSWNEVRRYTLIHYVYSGKGTFEKDGKTYHLSKGDAFIINEGEENYYHADKDDPWHYFWLSFSPDSFDGRFKTLESPVFKIKNETIFTEPIERAECGTLTREFVIAKLYLLYDEIFNSAIGIRHDTATEAAIYINHNITEDLSVSAIAEDFGLDRSYLSRIFKKKHGISMKQYIINARMTKATELLKKGVSVKEAAFMSGYDDALAFSRMFKKVYGITPKDVSKENDIIES